MFDLTYLPTEKKRLLEKAQDRLARALSPDLRKETLLLIQDILTYAKPYQKCDLAEADELRIQLLSKINILAGIGKLNSIEVFRMHLKEVEFHIQTLQIAEKLAEENKFGSDEPPNLKDKLPTLNSVERAKKTKKAFGHPRWMIGFEDDEVDEKNH